MKGKARISTMDDSDWTRLILASAALDSTVTEAKLQRRYSEGNWLDADGRDQIQDWSQGTNMVLRCRADIFNTLLK